MADRSRLRLFKGPGFQQFRKKFRVSRPRPISVIDLDGPLVRVVQTGARGSRTAITRIVTEKLDWAPGADRADPALVGNAIAKTLSRMRIKPGPVVMGVPRALVVLRTLSLPVIEDLRELASMVHFQIAKDLPFSVEEAVIDFTVRGRIAPALPPSNGKSSEAASDGKAETSASTPGQEVLVAAVTREVVEFYELAAAAAGLKLSALGWLSYANARCLEACRVVEGEKGVALISLRPDEVSIDVIAQQSLLFSRGATIKPAAEPSPASPASTPAATEPGLAQPTAEQPLPAVPENFVEAVTIEVVRSLHSYGGMEPHIPMTKLVVAGVTGHEAAVVDALRSRLNIACTLLDPASALELPKAAREHAAGSISAVGLALGANDPQGLTFDFLNPKRPAVQRNMRRIRMMMGAAAACAVLLLVGGVQRSMIKKKEILFDALKAELTQANGKRPIYRQMRLQATTLQNWVQDRRRWLEHYAYLSAILPKSEEIYCSSLSISAQGAIRLAVQARSGEVLAKLEKQLRAAGYTVKPLAINPGADRHGYNFRSNVELTFPEDMKIDLAKVRPLPRPADDASLETLAAAGHKGGGQ